MLLVSELFDPPTYMGTMNKFANQVSELKVKVDTRSTKLI